jgi:MscS family membrane protein
LAVAAGAVILAVFVASVDFHAVATHLRIETERQMLGLGVWQWLASIAVILAGTLVGHAVSVLCGWAHALRDRTDAPSATDAARHGVRRSLGLLAGVAFCWAALKRVELGEAWLFVATRAAQVVFSAAAIWLVYSMWDGLCDVILERTANDRRAEKLLVPVTRKLVRFFIVLGGALIGLASMGANVAGVLAGLGIGGLAVALAAKDSVENIFGSLTILFDMPFAIGDWVRIGAVDGVVEEINLRSTRIRTFQDSMITLPNSNLIKASVENFGLRRFRQLKMRLTVPFETPEESLAAFCTDLREAVRALPRTRGDRMNVSTYDLADAGVVLLIECFIECETYEEELEEREAVLHSLLRIARTHGIRAAVNPPT